MDLALHFFVVEAKYGQEETRINELILHVQCTL